MYCRILSYDDEENEKVTAIKKLFF